MSGWGYLLPSYKTSSQKLRTMTHHAIMRFSEYRTRGKKFVECFTPRVLNRMTVSLPNLVAPVTRPTGPLRVESDMMLNDV